MFTGHRYKGIPVLLAVSFFVLIFASCGIPQFCNFTSTNLSSKSNSDGSIELSLKSTKDEEDLDAKVTGGPYIALFYTVSEDQLTSSEKKEIVQAFEEEFGKGSNAKKQISVVTNRFVIESKKLCAFTIGEGSLPVAPSYHIDTNQFGQLRADYTASLSFAEGKVSIDGIVSLGRFDSNDSTFPTTIGSIDSSYSDMADLQTGCTSYHINVFAAFTAVGQFTNTYWSELIYAGDFTIELQ